MLLMALLALIYLRWQGRIWWCECGNLNPISLNVNSKHCSQHLLDPYSFSHFLHGILFFGLLWPFRERLSIAWRFVISCGVEIAWEMMENSPFIINRYRDATAAQGYTGDAILNSFGDLLSLMIGFYAAKVLGLWKSIAVGVAIELIMLWLIRDNLSLNVLMLLWPIDAIRKWQMGG